jgi:hypothetical protein
MRSFLMTNQTRNSSKKNCTEPELPITIHTIYKLREKKTRENASEVQNFTWMTACAFLTMRMVL